MPFKSYAIKEQALLGAKEYVARVEADTRAYCSAGYTSTRGIGCIISEATWAVLGNRVGLVAWQVQPVLGLTLDEETTVFDAHDKARKSGHAAKVRAVNKSLDILAAIPVGDES
jgi:hypothetical protein